MIEGKELQYFTNECILLESELKMTLEKKYSAIAKVRVLRGLLLAYEIKLEHPEFSDDEIREKLFMNAFREI